MRETLAAAVLLGALAGCAPVPAAPPPRAPATPPMGTPATVTAVRDTSSPGTPVGTTASGGTITARPGPATAPTVADSTPSEEALAVLSTIPEPAGVEEPRDSTHLPVPAPTHPLGDRPGARPLPVLAESLAAPVAQPAAEPDTCWRVQVLAPPEREHAERTAAVARSQLLVEFRVVPEGGLFKVRTQECLSAVAANDLRRRAIESGFEGAFRFRERPK